MDLESEPQWNSWDDHITWLVSAYKDGHTASDIARAVDGLSYQQILRRLKDAGVDIDNDYSKSGANNPLTNLDNMERPSLYETRKGVPEWCDDWRVYLGWLAGRYQERGSMNNLAKDTRLSVTTIRERLYQSGVPINYDHHKVGEEHPQWKGGQGWRNGDVWRRARLKVVDRDNRQCQDCGYEPQKPQVHHIEPVSEGGDRYDQENLVTLCGPCHRTRHK